MKVLCALITLGIAGTTVAYVPQDSRLSDGEIACENRQIGSRVNDPSRCKAYWICKQTGPARANCSESGVFHPEEGKCVPIADYSCEDIVYTTSVNSDEDCGPCTAGGPVLSMCEEGYNFNIDLELCVLSEEFNEINEENPCANRQIGSRVNDPSSCKAYWFCGKMGPEPARCPELTVFHRDLEKCVLIAEYSCEDTTDSPNVCSYRENGEKVNSDEGCGAYWKCTADGPVLSSCEDGYNFHTDLEVCVLIKEFNCGVDEIVEVIPVSPCFGIANGQFIDNPKNCKAYYYCFGNYHYEGECEAASFNPENQWCDWQYYCKDKPRVKS